MWEIRWCLLERELARYPLAPPRTMLASFAVVSGYMVQPLGSASCHARAAGAARLPSPCLQADDGPLAGAQAAFSIYQKSQAPHREVEKHVWWMLWIKSRCFK